MSYIKYGITPEFVERVKRKMKNPETKERVKKALQGVTKTDLQDRSKVRALVNRCAAILGEKLSDQMTDNMIRFVIDQKIDPNNTLHLIKLWGMFR
ncbi:stage VI sporulation protein F [Paenibacillus sp. y28]|uniref:stage VI sporulation protein F n=1 Tax=Paenibacillus sp. y28 TaxID=3129110 RepID=UPI00301A0218